MTASLTDLLLLAQTAGDGGSTGARVVGSLLTVVAIFLLLWFWLNRTVLGRGFRVPFSTMFSAVETWQYPEKPRPVAPRFHGRHQLNRYEDGLEKCIGCELCAWACPADAIYVQGADNTRMERFSPGERYAVDYQINYNRCILCGLCIEACPTRSLTMTHEYEISFDSHENGIWTKEMLLEPMKEGMQPTPHTDAEVRERNISYYGGLAVSPPTLNISDLQQASPAPAARARSVVGHLDEHPLPDTDERPEDLGLVGPGDYERRDREHDLGPENGGR